VTALRRILVVLILAATSLVFASARPAWACSCAAIDDHLDRAATAFVGVASEVDEAWSGREVKIRFDVEDMLKGDPAAEIELITDAEGAACGYEFTEGHRYRVYADRGVTGLCDGNEDLGVAALPGTTAGPGPDTAAPEAELSTGLWTTAAGGAAVVVAGLAFLLLRRRREGQ
jgi:hypothetical protein